MCYNHYRIESDIMNEKGLIEQVLRIINANYSNIYAIDIENDKVYIFAFTVANSLVIKEVISYTDFIEMAPKFIYKDDVSSYFDAISLNKLISEAEKGNRETKVKYRKLSETGEYRYAVNIINYLPFEGKKLIFMMSEDINERLVESEENNIRLESEVINYKNKINKENESISNAIVQINDLLENNKDEKVFKMANAKDYINSLFNQVSIEHPELNSTLAMKMNETDNYVRSTILIVDDSTIIRNSLKKIFDKDYNVITANNGLEAVDLITKNVLKKEDSKINIVGILLDILMPGSDGFVVLEFMKNFNLFSKIPVAIISGDESRETRKRVYDYDIVDMLEKPFNTEVIRKRINKIINLYLSSNNLQGLLLKQGTNNNNLNVIMERIVKNIINNEYSTNLKRIVQILTSSLASNYPNYKIDTKYMSAIVEGCVYYNIGAIAIYEKVLVTSNSIKEEINYGLDIIDALITDNYQKGITTNIIKYSCEMYNGTGYPDGLKGNTIPIEAQITNLAVRLCNKDKTMTNTIKMITSEENKYNPDLVDILNKTKKDLKSVMN